MNGIYAVFVGFFFSGCNFFTQPSKDINSIIRSLFFFFTPVPCLMSVSSEFCISFIWSLSLMAEAFLKSGVVLACPFLFKLEVPGAGWKLCVHGQSFIDLWVSLSDDWAWPGFYISGPYIFRFSSEKNSVSPEKNFLLMGMNRADIQLGHTSADTLVVKIMKLSLLEGRATALSHQTVPYFSTLTLLKPHSP